MTDRNAITIHLTDEQQRILRRWDTAGLDDRTAVAHQLRRLAQEALSAEVTQ